MNSFLDQFILYIVVFLMLFVAVSFGSWEVYKKKKASKTKNNTIMDLVRKYYPQMVASDIVYGDEKPVEGMEIPSLYLEEIKVGPGTYYRNDSDEFNLETVTVTKVEDVLVYFVNDSTNEEGFLPRSVFLLAYTERTNIPNSSNLD